MQVKPKYLLQSFALMYPLMTILRKLAKPWQISEYPTLSVTHTYFVQSSVYFPCEHLFHTFWNETLKKFSTWFALKCLSFFPYAKNILLSTFLSILCAVEVESAGSFFNYPSVYSVLLLTNVFHHIHIISRSM